MTKSQKLGYFILVVSLVFVVIITYAAIAAPSSPPKPEVVRVDEPEVVQVDEPKEEPTLYVKLASVGEGRYVAPDSDIAKEYEWYLVRLADKTLQSEEVAADMIVKTWQMLQDDVNPTEYLLDVLKTVYELIPRGSENVDLAEIAGLYVISRMAD